MAIYKPLRNPHAGSLLHRFLKHGEVVPYEKRLNGLSGITRVQVVSVNDVQQVLLHLHFFR